MNFHHKTRQHESKLHPQEEKVSHSVLKPPAKNASPKFGSDVATRPSPGELRDAVLQFPVVALKMSTAVDVFWPSTANIMRNKRGQPPNVTHFIPQSQPHQKAM
jgi:hypothetical protein